MGVRARIRVSVRARVMLGLWLEGGGCGSALRRWVRVWISVWGRLRPRFEFRLRLRLDVWG